MKASSTIRGFLEGSQGDTVGFFNPSGTPRRETISVALMPERIVAEELSFLGIRATKIVRFVWCHARSLSADCCVSIRLCSRVKPVITPLLRGVPLNDFSVDFANKIIYN